MRQTMVWSVMALALGTQPAWGQQRSGGDSEIRRLEAEIQALKAVTQGLEARLQEAKKAATARQAPSNPAATMDWGRWGGWRGGPPFGMRPPASSTSPAPAPPAAAAPAARNADIEQRLDRLLREVEEIRRDLRRR